MDRDLLNILACPKCRGMLELDESHAGLRCRFCCVVYPIVDDIPVLLPDEAIADSEWESRRNRAALVENT